MNLKLQKTTLKQITTNKPKEIYNNPTYMTNNKDFRGKHVWYLSYTFVEKV